MRILFTIILFLTVFRVSASTPADSTVYQFENDTILQTLVIKWTCDTAFDYRLMTQDLLDRGSVSVLGKARIKGNPDEPEIKRFSNSEYPSVPFESKNGDCLLTFYLQYLHNEKVVVERSCHRPPMFPHAPLESIGILEKKGN